MDEKLKELIQNLQKDIVKNLRHVIYNTNDDYRMEQQQFNTDHTMMNSTTNDDDMILKKQQLQLLRQREREL